MAGKRNKKNKARKAAKPGASAPGASSSEAAESAAPEQSEPPGQQQAASVPFFADRRKAAMAVASLLLPIVMFAYLFSLNMKMKLNDPDLWWHLKTGDYILENWQVPDVDPFAYTSPHPLSPKQKRGLRAQWLGQALYASAHRVAGLDGVAILRNILIILPMIVIYLWLWRRGVSSLVTFALISMPAFMFSIQLFYSFERPQGLSFNLVLITAILLERARRKVRSKGFDFSFAALPLFMAFWSNMHAGYIVGTYVVLIYMFFDAASQVYFRYYKKTPELAPRPVLLIVGALSILATGFNPNGFSVFSEYTSGLLGMFTADVSRTIGSGGGGGSWVKEVVLEYKPLWYFYETLHYDWLVFYWGYSAVLVAYLAAKYIRLRRVDFAELCTVGFFILFANMYARGIMFSLAIMPLYMGKSTVDLLSEPGAGRKMNYLLKTGMALTLALFVAFVTYTAKQTPHLLKAGQWIRGEEWVTPWYPTKAAEFLREAKISPPMYNYYTWGGYLIWSIYPEYQVFIDGRAIDNGVSRTADQILKTFPGWEKTLEVYNINFVVIPAVFRESGHIIPLAIALVSDPDWSLVFVKNNSLVFVRNHPRNADLLKKHNVNKDMVYWEIIAVENLFLQSSPTNDVFNMAKADALFGLKRYKEAKALYAHFPIQAGRMLQRLEQMGY